jgi:hypothetical protein
LKNGDDSQGEEKKQALAYLEEAEKKKDAFIYQTLKSFKGGITKEALIETLKTNWFTSYKLRLAITGKKLADIVTQAQL